MVATKAHESLVAEARSSSRLSPSLLVFVIRPSHWWVSLHDPCEPTIVIKSKKGLLNYFR